MIIKQNKTKKTLKKTKFNSQINKRKKMQFQLNINASAWVPPSHKIKINAPEWSPKNDFKKPLNSIATHSLRACEGESKNPPPGLQNIFNHSSEKAAFQSPQKKILFFQETKVVFKSSSKDSVKQEESYDMACDEKIASMISENRSLTDPLYNQPIPSKTAKKADSSAEMILPSSPQRVETPLENAIYSSDAYEIIRIADASYSMNHLPESLIKDLSQSALRVAKHSNPDRCIKMLHSFHRLYGDSFPNTALFKILVDSILSQLHHCSSKELLEIGYFLSKDLDAVDRIKKSMIELMNKDLIDRDERNKPNPDPIRLEISPQTAEKLLSFFIKTLDHPLDNYSIFNDKIESTVDWKCLNPQAKNDRFLSSLFNIFFSLEMNFSAILSEDLSAVSGV